MTSKRNGNEGRCKSVCQKHAVENALRDTLLHMEEGEVEGGGVHPDRILNEPLCTTWALQDSKQKIERRERRPPDITDHALLPPCHHTSTLSRLYDPMVSFHPHSLTCLTG